MKTRSTYQRCYLIFVSYHQKRNPYKSPFKWNSVDDIVDGEVQIPEQLTQFFTYLVVGPDHRSHESTSKIRRVESLAADTVFLVTNRRKKPSKHLKLELAVKSMAGSKKLTGILKRYGHYVSYRTTEELETEVTFTVTSASKVSPPDLVLDSSLTVGIANDNFHRFVKTLSAKNTLHVIVGIVYQSVSEETSRAAATALENHPSASGESMSRRKRRITLESFGVDIEPYHKKPKMYRSTTDSRALPSGKNQQFIVDDSVQHSPKVYSYVGWLECTASN